MSDVSEITNTHETDGSRGVILTNFIFRTIFRNNMTTEIFAS